MTLSLIYLQKSTKSVLNTWHADDAATMAYWKIFNKHYSVLCIYVNNRIILNLFWVLHLYEENNLRIKFLDELAPLSFFQTNLFYNNYKFQNHNAH